MKIVVCATCNDWQSPDTHQKVRRCSCMSTYFKWQDHQRGILAVFSVWGKENVRVMGMHNGWVRFGFEASNPGNPASDAEWREVQETICTSATGYIFHQEKRDCPVSIFGVGQTSDVIWSYGLKDEFESQQKAATAKSEAVDASTPTQVDGPSDAPTANAL